MTDAEWARLRPHIPVAALGRLSRNLRSQVDGIAFKYRTGIAWRDLPERYGRWETVYARFAAWREDGTIERLFSAVLADADARGVVDWSLVSVDSTTNRAHQHASGLVVPEAVLAAEEARLAAKGAPENQEASPRIGLLAEAIKSSTRKDRHQMRRTRRAAPSGADARPAWPQDCSDAPEAG